jgi:hypothetical protein
MPYVEGESLRARLAREKHAVAEMVLDLESIGPHLDRVPRRGGGMVGRCPGASTAIASVGRR